MKMLMSVGMMAAACAFGGVYDDCVYLFEGGIAEVHQPSGIVPERVAVEPNAEHAGVDV